MITKSKDNGHGRIEADADTEWLRLDETEPAFNETYAQLCEAVRATGRELIPRCGKREGVIAWRDEDTHRVWVKLHPYNKKTFRLSTAGTWYFYGNPQPRAPYQFEMSFAPSEADEISEGFVRFVESAFASGGDPNLIWRWPLFAHWSSFPHYAWTKLGKERQTRKETLQRL